LTSVSSELEKLKSVITYKDEGNKQLMLQICQHEQRILDQDRAYDLLKPKYFWSSVLAIKLDAGMQNVSTQALWEAAQEQDIPIAEWPGWISKQIRTLAH
jgi:hypothetical protein